jgi:hypothetical protein
MLYDGSLDIWEKVEVSSGCIFLCSVRRLLVTANIPSSPIHVTLMLEALHSSETSVFTRLAWHSIPEDCFRSVYPFRTEYV